MKTLSFLLVLFMLSVSSPAQSSKARQKALQTDVIGLPVERLQFDPGFEKYPQKDPLLPLAKLKVPEGFQISIFAVVPKARSLALGEKGEVFVGTREDKVYRLHDGNLDGRVELAEILLAGLNSPNGVAFKDGDLYVAEIHQILRIKKIRSSTAKNLKPEVLPQKFPADRHHGWKFIRFGPDGWLYVPVGAPCNVCDPGSDYARIFKIDIHSDKKEVVAQGVRNTVGFDWDPSTRNLWFTDNGRDMMGEDVPADEVNQITKPQEHFGFPFCHGKNLQDPQFRKDCSGFTPPRVELPAHVAALGMRFWKNEIVLAEHGSWNRSKPQGYRVSKVTFGPEGRIDYQPWIEGWLQPDGSRWGRPVDVEVYFDGSLLISDDEAGVIYRVAPKK